jgi:uridine kinase
MHQVSRSLGLIWSDLFREPIFQFGIVVKLILVIFLVPDIQQDWFVPFIVNWIENPTSLPWFAHLSSGGDSQSFPYGPIMFIVNLPSTFLGWIFDNMFGIQYFASFGFRISLFFADMLLLMVLLQTFEDYWKKILIYYWLSPIVLFVTYWHGQIDLIPVTLFICALALLKTGKFRISGLLLASAIAAKHSMLIGVPFIVIYLWSHNGIHREFQKYLVFFIGSLLMIEAPFILFDAYRVMVLENRELDKLYWLFIDMSNGNAVYLVLMIYLLLLYFFWRIKRVNFDLLIAVLGVSFSIVILMTPSPPGWYLWLVPIFVIHQSRYGTGAVWLVGSFSILFIFYHLMYTSGALILFYDYDLVKLTIFEGLMVKSVHYTLIVSFGLLIAIQLLREGVRENDYYKLGIRPVSLGIAGDSGVGKTTFSNGLASIFGERSIAEVSGDDYHNWDRASPMWKTMTHLNPKANKLFQLVKDVRSLLDGSPVNARSYNHSTGNFSPTKIRNSRDVILVEGLHALYPNQLIEELDVRIYIQMDESLRAFLRINRDVRERGYIEEQVRSEIERRKVDSQKYIQPQALRSDIVFLLLPINTELIEKDYSLNSNLKIRAVIRNGVYYDELVRVLIGVCGLQVNLESIDEKGEVIIEVSGDLASEDVNLAVNILVPHMVELFDFSAEFEGGVQGIMQIITLMELDEALKRRRIS